jgi:hypothetical protein
MEAATRAMEEVSKRMEEASRAAAMAATVGVMATAGAGGGGGVGMPLLGNVGGGPPGPAGAKYGDVTMTSSAAQPPCKRPTMFDDDRRFLAHLGVPTAHLKMTSHNNGGRLEYDNSMVVSMEINGLMYQGVLFAQHPGAVHHRI